MSSLAAMSRRRAPGSCAMHSRTRAWLVRKVQLGAANLTVQFWKLFAGFIQLAQRRRQGTDLSRRRLLSWLPLRTWARPPRQSRVGQESLLACADGHATGAVPFRRRLVFSGGVERRGHGGAGRQACRREGGSFGRGQRRGAGVLRAGGQGLSLVGGPRCAVEEA